jgi:hypothetical protein
MLSLMKKAIYGKSTPQFFHTRNGEAKADRQPPSGRPQLVLVDEFAHTNAPGARHPKRYQDVAELLNAGIDVFTTLNVQHVESRAEAVRQITSTTIRETVPDTALCHGIFLAPSVRSARR